MFHALAARCRGPSASPQVLPPGHEAEYFTPGIGHGMFRYKGFNVGMLICYDAEFPELARLLARAGADLILVPTASSQVEPSRLPHAVHVLPALGGTRVPRARPCCRARMPPVSRQ